MNPSDERVNEPPLSSRITTGVAIGIVVLQILIALLVYPFLPALLPSHWNAAGEIDAYLPKALALALFPFISLCVYFLIRFLINLGPSLSRPNQRTSVRANINVVSIVLLGEVLLMLVLELVTIAAGFHLVVNIRFVLSITLSALFIFVGNYFGKFRRNFWAGIRTPWTLASDTVWERTHRIGGWLFVAVGLLGLLLSFIPFLQLWGLLGLVLPVMVFLYVYSYSCYQQLTRGGGEPFSPPFDEGN